MSSQHVHSFFSTTDMVICPVVECWMKNPLASASMRAASASLDLTLVTSYIYTSDGTMKMYQTVDFCVVRDLVRDALRHHIHCACGYRTIVCYGMMEVSHTKCWKLKILKHISSWYHINGFSPLSPRNGGSEGANLMYPTLRSSTPSRTRAHTVHSLSQKTGVLGGSAQNRLRWERRLLLVDLSHLRHEIWLPKSLRVHNYYCGRKMKRCMWTLFDHRWRDYSVVHTFMIF